MKLLRFLAATAVAVRLCERGFTGIRTCARLQKRCVLLDCRGCGGRTRRTTPPHRLYLSATGTDVTDALLQPRSILPGDLYLSHAQVLLLSEDAVSESILPLADYLCRENDVRLSLRAAVVRDGSPPSCWRTTTRCTRSASCLTAPRRTAFCRICRCTASPMCCTQTAQPFFRPCAWMRSDRRHRQARQWFKNERLNCFLDGEIGGGAYA